MAHDFNLTLPPTAPAAYISQVQETCFLPTAVYTLIPLSEGEIHEVACACELESGLGDGEVVRPAPEPHFVSQPLGAVYNSHLQLGVQGEFDPFFFVVVVDNNWRESGVLLVTLENDDEPPTIDSFFCKPEGVSFTVQNLQIANSDWTECRELYEVRVHTGGDEDEEGKADKNETVESPTDAEVGQSDDEGPAYPSKKPDYGYLIPIYILESMDTDTLISILEENVQDKPNPFTDYRIRSQASLKPTVQSDTDITTLSKPDQLITNDIIAQACALHPIRCRANKWLNKTYFLVCDNTQPSKSGLVLVKLDWDGMTKGRSKAELREIGTNASRETTRLSGTCQDGIQYGYAMIANDMSILSRRHPAFALFQLNADSPHHGAKIVDAQHWDRTERDNYFVVAWSPMETPHSSSLTTAPEGIDMSWTLEEAVNKFPWFCYLNRFEPLFNRYYFMWFDHKTVGDEGVVLVRYDWDGNIERSEEELWGLRQLDAVRTLRIPAAEAMAKILTAAKDGSEDWAWEAYRG
ncbi:hypothetical protein GQ44DRAFT_707937 [Phaeosphaeriaceae sp. PMI808]|nr:hypothetical protein GQ44DRAFT_707937 [Phaeosphaeriaceae sp. PMI808]